MAYHWYLLLFSMVIVKFVSDVKVISAYCIYYSSNVFEFRHFNRLNSFYTVKENSLQYSWLSKFHFSLYIVGVGYYLHGKTLKFHQNVCL